MDIEKGDTAVVFIDPQNDVLSEKGANWGAVGASVTENDTVGNMERVFKAAKTSGYAVFISPHYFYPTDTGGAHAVSTSPTLPPLRARCRVRRGAEEQHRIAARRDPP